MNQSPAPLASLPRTHATFTAITRLLLRLVLAAWTLFALTWGALHLWIVPRIGEWRPDLERWASAAVGVPVTIGSISAETQDGTGSQAGFLLRLVPVLELGEVRLFDPAGREALLLPRVRAAVSVTSLWRRGFEQLLIVRPVLDVRRTGQGEIQIAGLNFSGPREPDSRAADWFFSQTELVIQDGTVRWTDDLRRQEPLELGSLSFVSRNSTRSHLLRLDATPPTHWGQRFSLRASLREPLLDLSPFSPDQTPWHNWSGEIYGDFPQVDVARLRAYLDLSQWGAEVRSGQGALRLWADVTRGQLAGVTADLGLRQVAARLGQRLPELALESVDGRVSASWDPQGYRFDTDGLSFRTREGQVWPASTIHLQHDNGLVSRSASTTLNADRMDLAALSALATRVPLPEVSRELLNSLQPAGTVEKLNARWRSLVVNETPSGASGPTPLPITDYQVKGRVVGLALAGRPSGKTSAYGPYPVPGRPGLTGASANFELNQHGGQARINIANGSVNLPGMFEAPEIPITSLQADAHWTVRGERIEAWFENLRMANADATGTARLHWQTSDPARSASASRFPGVIDLHASLTRGNVAQTHRYLPLSLSPEVRHYVREAVRGGTADKIDFRVRGDLWDLPYHLPNADGEFRVAAKVRGVTVAYLPTYLQSAGEPPWPALNAVTGQLLLDRASLQLNELSAGVEGLPTVRLSNGEATVSDLMKTPVLRVSAHAHGPASEVLDFVQNSPVNGLIGGALARTTATGPTDLSFALQLPLENPDALALQGQVQLGGNDLRFTPDSPLLERSVGKIGFSEQGFALSGAQARLFGGAILIEGGMPPAAKGGPGTLEFRGQGTASAEALRDGGLGFTSRLFGQASGSASYNARLAFRAGVPELQVTTQLQGMSVHLPPPLAKRAEESLPVRYANTVLGVASGADGETALSDRLSVEIGSALQPIATVLYERDVTATEARVLRGSVAVGLLPGESAPMPDQGVLANFRLARVNVDTWLKVLNAVSGEEAGDAAPSPPGAGLSYLPTTMAFRADQLQLEGRTFNGLVLGGSREDHQWRVNVDADEVNGYVEYRQPSAGHAGSIYARLARLNLERSTAEDVENLLQQPSSVPALDITIDNLVLAGRSLGLVNIQAVNRGTGRNREWRLNKLNIRVPEARLIASGNWATSEAGPTARRTHLDFRLDIDDSAQLLSRFGRPGVVRGGSGSLEGALGWHGSPFALDYPSLSGEIRANISSGQFLKVDPGAAKLLGVLSLQALPRRLTLDFRDVFSDGFAFDFVRGDVRIEQGVAHTNNLQMKGINAAVLMEGSADIAREQQNLQVVVVPDLNAGTASLIATAINPAVGLGTFLAQFLLRAPLQSAATQQFQISGSWTDPKVEKK